MSEFKELGLSGNYPIRLSKEKLFLVGKIESFYGLILFTCPSKRS